MPTTTAQQPGLAMSISPDDGLGDRMSYVQLVDGAGGVDVNFSDTPDPTECLGAGTNCFVTTTVATLSRVVPHTIRFHISFVDGPDNDVVELSIDGSLVVTGTTWENYYRNSPEQAGNGNTVAATDDLEFRTAGAAVPANLGAGLRFDNVQLTSGPAAASYADTVLASSPAGYWRLGDSAPSTTLTDSSGHANNGAYLGGVTLGVPGAISGDADTAASFDGVNDTGRVPDSNSLDVGDSFTLEGWVKRSSAAKTVELFNKGARGLQLDLMSGGSGSQLWLRKAGVTTIARTAAGVPVDTAFHHIVATKNGPNSTQFYIDGALATAIPVSGVQVVQDTTFPLTFGVPGIQATFDEFALYDAVLSAADVLAHYQAGQPAI